jgi:hypothetical protein
MMGGLLLVCHSEAPVSSREESAVRFLMHRLKKRVIDSPGGRKVRRHNPAQLSE